MPLGIKIELSGIDITDKVSRFEITASVDSYVRELSLDLADPDYYDTFDFSVLPEAPTLEVFTRIASTWISQGKFFIEKPTYRVGIHRTDTGLWGRSSTALLGAPFAPKVRKVWSQDVMFFAVCEEMCALAGLTWNAAYSDIPDFLIHAYSYQAEGLYPIEVLSELLALVYGEDARLTTDREGHVCIRLINRAPAAYDFDVTDLVIAEIAEEPEWPEFGNRVKISATSSTSGFGVQLSVRSACLAPGYRTKLLARVTDQDGNPVNGIPVAWSVKNGLATLDWATSNTQSVTITDEEVRAQNFYEIPLEYPPVSIVGVWAAKDTGRTQNLAEAGYEIDGNTVILTGKLLYCDQLVRVAYTSDGIAVNWATAGSEGGTETVTADVGGNSDSAELYVDNPCACPPSITFKSDTSTIKIGESARLLTYVEIAGAPVSDGRSVYNTIDSVPAHGVIDWTENALGFVTVINEKTAAVNESAGFSQCELSMFPHSVGGVWTFTEDDDGNVTKTGPNLYSSHSGKTVSLSAQLPGGTELLVDYVARGATVNTFFGKALGTEQIRAFIITTREAPTEATLSITVTDETNAETPDLNDGTDLYDDPFDVEDPGGGGGGSDPRGSWDDTHWDPSPMADCTGQDGKTIKCDSGKTCCEKNKVRGCYTWTECDKSPDGCYTKDCTKTGDQNCLQSRFTEALKTEGYKGCTCDELCSKEFDKWGTTQTQFSSQVKRVADIVVEDFGFAEGTPEYWEKFDELKAQNLSECVAQCDACSGSVSMAVSGPSSVVKPGGYQYAVTGASGKVEWSVNGSGATIDAGGYVTLSENACGTITIVAVDECGVAATLKAMITNAGRWVRVDSNESKCPPDTIDFGYCVKGATRYWVYANTPYTYPNECNYYPWWVNHEYYPNGTPICMLVVEEWQC